MGTWQDGYVIDVPYTAGFYRELSPTYLHLLAVLLGIQPPAAVDGAFSYCELGCGRGLGPLLMAAANPLGRFYAYDFNEAQIAPTRAFAERSGLGNVHFGSDSFASLAAGGAGSAPAAFDLIVLHGVWSWVGAESRRHLLHYLRDRLKPGGMVYVSYNCMPGWASFTPVRRLMRELVIRRRGRTDESALAAREFIDQLAAKGARYFSADASIGGYLVQLGERDGSYLAHEYVNEHWDAFYHLDILGELAQAQLGYIGSATVSDNIGGLSASPEIAAMFAGADPGMAETIRDFTVNRRFRRDLFAREPERLSPAQFLAELGRVRFMLAVEPAAATTTLMTAAGELKANESIALPVLERLKKGSADVAELLALPGLTALPAELLAQTLSLLVESGQLHPMRASTAGHVASHKLNDLLIEEAQGKEPVHFLAAPLLGSAVYVGHAEQLILLAMREVDGDGVGPLRDQVWAWIKARDQRVLKDGNLLESEADNVSEVERRVGQFLEQRLPLLRSFGVVP